jgi:hypothetical protein
MPASKPSQAGDCIPQVVIFDVRCRIIQPVRWLCRKPFQADLIVWNTNA